jgi:hypothetical protein
MHAYAIHMHLYSYTYIHLQMPLLREEEGRIVVACSKKEVMKKVKE